MRPSALGKTGPQQDTAGIGIEPIIEGFNITFVGKIRFIGELQFDGNFAVAIRLQPFRPGYIVKFE